MKRCSACGKAFDPAAAAAGPAAEIGAFLARELFGDEGAHCPACLESRGVLGMMYCREFD
jgi:hypothetical protein